MRVSLGPPNINLQQQHLLTVSHQTISALRTCPEKERAARSRLFNPAGIIILIIVVCNILGEYIYFKIEI